MKNLAFAGLALCIFAAGPAYALEHRTTIDHPGGEIAADYRGDTRISTKQVGSAGPGGRASTLRCNWTVSLSVERIASAGTGLHATRSMTREEALKGSHPGWCSSGGNEVERIVQARREVLREAMLAMVAQDRETILAEAENARQRARAG